jgi:hypothetical protein
MGRILQLLLVLFLLRLLGRAVASWLRGQPAKKPATVQGTLVRDRVCNTHLPRHRALVAQVAGREEYFCSAACRDHALATARQAS